MLPPGTPVETIVLEQGQLFSQSVIWQWQRRYFMEKGPAAWQTGEVPQYITSNPSMANAYAEMAFAVMLDCQDYEQEQPLYLIELGGGSGRFAFQVLRQLEKLCHIAGVPLTLFRYLLTDFTQHNINFWSTHPSFAHYCEQGVLDFSLFDFQQPDKLVLQVSGAQINSGDLHKPTIVIANYVFDSVPAELVYFKDGGWEACYNTITVPASMEGSEDAAALLQTALCRYDRGPMPGAFSSPWLNDLLHDYAKRLQSVYTLIPLQVVQSIDYLRGLSSGGCILLTADKGDYRLENITRNTAPSPVKHGSISLSVNYHAMAHYCRSLGGEVYYRPFQHASLHIGCLMLTPNPLSFSLTRMAWQRHMGGFNPDDYFTITQWTIKQLGSMSMEEINALIRLGYADIQLIKKVLPVLTQKINSLRKTDLQGLRQLMHSAWEDYFPLAEEEDIAFDFGMFMYRAGDYASAIFYFTRSVMVYGPDGGTLFNMAKSYMALEQPEAALPILETIYKHRPDDESVHALMAECKNKLTAVSV